MSTSVLASDARARVAYPIDVCQSLTPSAWDGYVEAHADGEVTLTGGERLDARIVVNVAGPHSFLVNRMAGVEEDMKVTTRPLRHEVHHVPSPPDFATFARGWFGAQATGDQGTLEALIESLCATPRFWPKKRAPDNADT